MTAEQIGLRIANRESRFTAPDRSIEGAAVQPETTFTLPHSGLKVPHTGYTVTSYREHKSWDGVAFTATPRLNGKIVGTIDNEGRGGPDTFHPTATTADRPAHLQET